MQPSNFIKTLARVMFDAYNKQAGGKTYDGKPIPPWDEIGDNVQARWFAAALAGADHCAEYDHVL